MCMCACMCVYMCAYMPVIIYMYARKLCVFVIMHAYICVLIFDFKSRVKYYTVQAPVAELARPFNSTAVNRKHYPAANCACIKENAV